MLTRVDHSWLLLTRVDHSGLSKLCETAQFKLRRSFSGLFYNCHISAFYSEPRECTQHMENAQRSPVENSRPVENFSTACGKLFAAFCPLREVQCAMFSRASGRWSVDAGHCQVWRWRMAEAAGPSSERAGPRGPTVQRPRARPKSLCQTFREPPAACDGPSGASAEPATAGRWPLAVGCEALGAIAAAFCSNRDKRRSEAVRQHTSHVMVIGTMAIPHRAASERCRTRFDAASERCRICLWLLAGRPWRDCCFLQWT